MSMLHPTERRPRKGRGSTERHNTMTEVTTEKPTSARVDFTHEELTVIQDVLRRAEDSGQLGYFVSTPQFETALEKCTDGMVSTMPRALTPEELPSMGFLPRS